jgi:hypothetical protein
MVQKTADWTLGRVRQRAKRNPARVSALLRILA